MNFILKYGRRFLSSCFFIYSLLGAIPVFAQIGDTILKSPTGGTTLPTGTISGGTTTSVTTTIQTEICNGVDDDGDGQVDEGFPVGQTCAESTDCSTSQYACDLTHGGAPYCKTTYASSATQCRASAGTCDVAEYCTGASATCPADSFASSTTECRASTGVCDTAEACTGSSATCPTDTGSTASATGNACGTCGDGILNTGEECDGSAGINPATQQCTKCRIENKDLCASATLNDSNACTIDTCDSATGTVTHTAVVPVDDGDVCTTDVCKSPTGENIHIPIENCCTTNEECQDGNLCNGKEQCVSNGCQSGTALDCNDDKDCTSDSCEATTGCKNDATASATGNACGTCGDGIVNSGEQCDGTVGVGEHQKCSEKCALVDVPYCGDGIVSGPEECESNSALSAHQSCVNCKIVTEEYCGDGIKNGSEECDGNDTTAGKTCTSNCTFVTTTETPPEETTQETTPNTTTATGSCGDGTVDTGEECDDGNTTDGDGCQADCTNPECTEEEQRTCDSTAGCPYGDSAYPGCNPENDNSGEAWDGGQQLCYQGKWGYCVRSTVSPCSDGATPVEAVCYGIEKASGEKTSGACNNSDEEQVAEIKDFTAPKNLVSSHKTLFMEDNNLVFKTDLVTGATKQIQPKYSFTKITDLGVDSTGNLYVADSGKVLKATKDGVSDLALNITVKKIAIDGNDNKYLLTEEGKLYKADSTGALTQLYDIKAERTGFEPTGKMVVNKGNLYLSDLAAGRVLQYNMKTGVLSELAEVTTPVELSVKRSTGDLLVQSLDKGTIYKIPLAETAAGQTVTPEVYMLAKITGMVEAKICPSVTTIERPTAETTETTETEEENTTEEEEETGEETVLTTTDSGTTETTTTEDEETDDTALPADESAIEGCVLSDGSPATLDSGDFEPPLKISDILTLKEGGSITTYANDVEYTATWNSSIDKVEFKSVTTGDTTACESLAEATADAQGAGAGCLNVAGSVPTPGSRVAFIWLILTFGLLIGVRIFRKSSLLRH
ncbi:MAG: DUF4215 domain-containing protein [Deltaproteobacteria bacterium]|nr:DUF4215 domain-containing protein [Deltaproteobacteria bacterium]